MSAPNAYEVAILKQWSLSRHFYNNASLYIGIGKRLYQAAKNGAAQMNGSIPFSLNEDQVASLIEAHLLNDSYWNSVLMGKSHLGYHKHSIVTNIMARYIAWNYFRAISI